MSDKPQAIMTGTVEKIIKPWVSGEPEKAQIGVHKADDLYRELRIKNALTDENGEELRLKAGAQVKVTVEANPAATTRRATSA